MDVSELRGATPEIAAMLKAKGITDTVQLASATGQPNQREELAAMLGISVCAVTELAGRADLTRIHGVARTYSDLLELAGVDTVTELRRRVPANLHAKLIEVAAQHSIQLVPRLDEVQRWVLQAKQLK